MANRSQRETHAREVPGPKTDPGVILLITGVICLGVGFGIGYYFGQQSTRSGTPPAVQTGSPLPNPGTFLQDEAALNAVLSANPRDLNALIRLGNLYYDSSRFTEAAEWYGRALELDSRNVDVRTDRGTCYFNLGKIDSAIADFQKSLEINPTHAQTLYNLGVVYLHGKNNASEARKAWERLLATNPNYPERAKVEQQLSTLSVPAEATAPEPPRGKSKGGMEDLMQRLKDRP